MLFGQRLFTVGLVVLTINVYIPVCSAQLLSRSDQKLEEGANTEVIPKQILKTGVTLNSTTLAPNSTQLANSIGLTPVLEQIHTLRSRLSSTDQSPSLERLTARQDFSDAVQKAVLIIEKTELEIDFTIAEIAAENEVYEEILATFTNDRDKAVARTNALAFISNGVLWAICEALAIPTFRNANFAIPSGIIGIPAGVVPSIASMYTLKQLNGKKKTSEVEPNMLAKLFGYPTTNNIEYPQSVWQFLNQVPANDPNGKTRKNQLIDRWISDANMPDFTDRDSKRQVEVLTATVAQRKGLTINSLTARGVMLQQLSAEILKMQRMLLDLMLSVQGEKQI